MKTKTLALDLATAKQKQPGKSYNVIWTEIRYCLQQTEYALSVGSTRSANDLYDYLIDGALVARFHIAP